MTKHFPQNKFNFVEDCMLCNTTDKGRGVISTRHIKAGTVIALFPGDTSFRIPSSGSLSISAYTNRQETDERLINTYQRTMPISDYAILTTVVDTDEHKRAIGYHYEVIEPLLSGDPESQMPGVLQAYRRLPIHEQTPTEISPRIIARAEALYAQLLIPGNIQVVKSLSPLNRQAFAFYMHTSDVELERHNIYMYTPTTRNFWPVCRKEQLHCKCACITRIAEGILTQKVQQDALFRIRDEAKSLRLPISHPYIAAFINTPNAHQRQNCILLDPSEWTKIGRRRLTGTHWEDIARPAVVALIDIRPGEELVTDYAREKELV